MSETTKLIEEAETIATLIEDRMWAALDTNDSNTLRQLAAALEAAAEETKAASDKHEREVLELITERDEAEESVSQIYYIVTGNSPEWSNNFGYTHAQDDVADVVNVFKQAAKSAQEGLSASATREKAWHDNIMLASGGHATTPEEAREFINTLRDMLDVAKGETKAAVEREKGLREACEQGRQRAENFLKGLRFPLENRNAVTLMVDGMIQALQFDFEDALGIKRDTAALATGSEAKP